MSGRYDHASPQLDAEKINGVYLLAVESKRIGYVVESGADEVHVGRVRINGQYIGTSGRFETECHDYTIDEEGEFGTCTLLYREDDGDD